MSVCSIDCTKIINSSTHIIIAMKNDQVIRPFESEEENN